MTAIPLEHGPGAEALRDAVKMLRTLHDGDITVTEDGRPVAVLVDPDELDGLREMVDILSTPGEAEAIDEGLRDEANGRLIDGPTALSAYLP